MTIDLVSRDEVLKSLAKEYNRKGSREGLKMAWIEKAVNDAPAPWTMCEEMLPGITGAYLVACTNGNVKVGHFTTFDNKWTDAKAVAWMPLPEWEGEADDV